MKATLFNTIGVVKEHVIIPEIYHTKPLNFDRYVWETADRDLIPIKEIDDSHLVNIYKILVNTILFAKEKSKHKILTSALRRVVVTTEYHIRYIAYELYVRESPVSYQGYGRINRYKECDATDSDIY